MFEWLYRLWYNVDDIPSDLLEQLTNNLQQGTQQDNVKLISDINGILETEYLTEIDSSIAQSIVSQTLSIEVPKWETALKSLINRRFINKATMLCNNITGSVRYKISYTKPTILLLIKQRDEVINKVDIDVRQIVSLTRICNLTKLDKSSVLSVYRLWFNTFVSYANTTLSAKLEETETIIIQNIVIGSIETLISNWKERLKLNPKKLSTKTDNKSVINNKTYDVEITEPINRKRMEEIRHLLINKLKNGTS